MPERLLRLKEVCELVGMSPSTVRRRIEDDGFPAGIRVGPRGRRYPLSEVEEWMKSRPRSS